MASVTVEPDWGVPIEAVSGRPGFPTVYFARDMRDEGAVADLLPRTPSQESVADLLLNRLPGWQVAAEPDLGRRLLARGATIARHAHTMAIDTSLAPDSWRDVEPGPGLRVEAIDVATLSPNALMPSQIAAYPPDHPDHEDETGTLGLLVMIMGGDVVGDLLPESSVVLAADTIVAGLIVNQRVGTSPAGGAWVADVWRHPDYPGTGTVLLQRAIVAMRDRGETHLTLTVTEGNPARARYDKLGFVHATEALRVKLPAGTIDDGAATATGWYLESWRLRARRCTPIDDHTFTVHDERFPDSFEHNRLITDTPRSGHELLALVDEHLLESGFRQIEVLGSLDSEAILMLTDTGYVHHEIVLMSRRALSSDDCARDQRVAVVDESVVAPFIAEQWRIDLPDATDDVITQLVARREVIDVGSRVIRLAAFVNERVVGSVDVVMRGPIAEVDALGVNPEFRQQGLGDALFAAAHAEAVALGCEVSLLGALHDDWPREWYERLGYVAVATSHDFTLPKAEPA